MTEDIDEARYGSAVQRWRLDWLEQAAMLSLTFMIIDIDNVSLPVFHGPAGHDNKRANYTDRATAASRRSGCQLLRIKDATWSA
jgi:hypothetical protein